LQVAKRFLLSAQAELREMRGFLKEQNCLKDDSGDKSMKETATKFEKSTTTRAPKIKPNYPDTCASFKPLEKDVDKKILCFLSKRQVEHTLKKSLEHYKK